MKTTLNSQIYDEIQSLHTSGCLSVHLSNKNNTLNYLENFLQNSDFLPKTLEVGDFLESITHSSLSHEIGVERNPSYERLEYLGDAVLQLIVSESLIEKYPELDEGQLSKLRGSLVNEDSLAEIGKALRLEDMVLLGKGQRTFEVHEGILSDLVESLLGAIYKSCGFDVAKNTFMGWIEVLESHGKLPFFDLKKLELFDPKSKLQEETMALYRELPKYEDRLIEDGVFEISVFIGDVMIAKGSGNNKKKVQKKLARKILSENLYKNIN